MGKSVWVLSPHNRGGRSRCWKSLGAPRLQEGPADPTRSTEPGEASRSGLPGSAASFYFDTDHTLDEGAGPRQSGLLPPRAIATEGCHSETDPKGAPSQLEDTCAPRMEQNPPPTPAHCSRLRGFLLAKNSPCFLPLHLSASLALTPLFKEILAF